MKIREIRARSILSRTRIPGIDYCINPYTGCAHACRYCYATFMKKFSDHEEPWGAFVDIKVNAVDLLRKALRSKHDGEVMLSSVTDPYQPVEKEYGLTRGCLELLAHTNLAVRILTKSGMVVRDIDVLRTMPDVEVGLTIATDDESVKRLFEPASASVASRIRALRNLHEAGIPIFIFIGPMLPMNPERLVDLIAPYARQVLIDRLNYTWKVRDLYLSHGLDYALEPAYFAETEDRLLRHLNRCGVKSLVV
jgi:DNA repair photolyase